MYLFCTGSGRCKIVDKTKILYVEDDSFVRQAICEYLRKELFDVVEAENGQELRDILCTQKIDLVLLDMILPDCDGMILLEEIKSQGDTPVIIISSRGEDVDRIIGIESGADDYLAKPASPRELKARINAVLRRCNNNTEASQCEHDDRILFDQWILDPSQYQVFNHDDVSAGLTTSEFLILHHLARSPKKVLTRDHLFEVTRQVNSDSYDRAVDIQITRIRKKISDDAKDSKYIKTVRGVGYLFCGAIQG